MRSPKLVLFLTYLFLRKMAHTTDLKLSSSFHQVSTFQSVNVGENVTLECSYEGEFTARLYWYKHTPGQKPRLISTSKKNEINRPFHDEFNNNPRFMLDTENGKNHLTITDVHISDSATYYCLSTYSYTIEFVETMVISVKGSGLKVPALVHQSDSETIQPGGSVTLNCVVQTGSCDGEHSVYWFKDSEEPHPGIIYTHGDRNDQCKRKPGTQTHSCVYNLPLKNLSVSHVGTYYCAVASCGHILFGNRTKVDLEVSGSADEVNAHVLVIVLSGALTFTTILVVLLTFLLYRKNGCDFAESQMKNPAPFTTNLEGDQDDNIHYAALSANRVNRSRKQRNNTPSECLYSSVKL